MSDDYFEELTLSEFFFECVDQGFSLHSAQRMIERMIEEIEELKQDIEQLKRLRYR